MGRYPILLIVICGLLTSADSPQAQATLLSIASLDQNFIVKLPVSGDEPSLYLGDSESTILYKGNYNGDLWSLAITVVSESKPVNDESLAVKMAELALEFPEATLESNLAAGLYLWDRLDGWYSVESGYGPPPNPVTVFGTYSGSSCYFLQFAFLSPRPEAAESIIQQVANNFGFVYPEAHESARGIKVSGQ